MVEIEVLRIGHRPERDKRITTHVCLVARTFGARKVYIDRLDERLEDGMRDVQSRFGGDMEVITGRGWRSVLRHYDGTVVHLTMYGEPLDWVVDEIRQKDRIMVIVGAEKVPSEIYHLADYNVAVGNEPHSEVAALAMFLDRINPSWKDMAFNGRMMVLPSREGKIVIHPGFMEEKRIERTVEDIPRLFDIIELPENIQRHVHAVWYMARDIAMAIEKHSGRRVDENLIALGSLLHDIGRKRTHSIHHCWVGGQIIRILGFDEKVARIAERHVGAGITPEEARKLNFPPRRSYMPETLEEKVIAHADNLIRETERVPIEYNIKRFSSLGHTRAAERLKKLHQELSELAGFDLDELV